MPKRKKVSGKENVGLFEVNNSKGETVFYGKYKKPNGKQAEVSLGVKGSDFSVEDARFELYQYRTGKKISNYDQRQVEKKQEKIALITTWDGFLKNYGEYVSDKNNPSDKPNKDKVSFYQSKKHLDNFIKPYFKSTSPHEVTEADGDAFKQHLKRMRYSKGYKRTIFELFKRLLKFNKNFNCITIDLPSVHSKQKVRPSKKQIKNIVDFLNQESYIYAGKWYRINRTIANAMLLMRYTGMRSIETRKLRWKDLDFENKKIILKEPKSGVDQKIPMSDKAREILERQIPQGDDGGHWWQDNNPVVSDAFVFPARGGKMLSNYSQTAKQYCTRAGMPEEFAPCHGFRFMFACELNDKGEPLPYIQRLLTHKNISTTMTYIEVDEQQLLAAANRIG